MGCHDLLQGIFPTQGWHARLLRPLHLQAGSLPLAPCGSPPLNQSSPLAAKILTQLIPESSLGVCSDHMPDHNSSTSHAVSGGSDLTHPFPPLEATLALLRLCLSAPQGSPVPLGSHCWGPWPPHPALCGPLRRVSIPLPSIAAVPDFRGSTRDPFRGRCLFHG